jgi:hypothetical protein
MIDRIKILKLRESISFTKYIASIGLTLCLSTNIVKADTMWFFEGNCHDSRVKWGTISDDMTKETGDPIHCNKAVLIELANGRKLMQFVTGLGVLGFSGREIDKVTNDKMSFIPIDTIHPIRDLGTKSDEIYDRSSKGEGMLRGVEGFCFFQAKDIKSSDSVSCVSKYENGNKKAVYSVQMKVSKVSKKLILPAPN